MRSFTAPAIVALLLALTPAVTHAATTIVLPRPGQVGIGVQGGYGALVPTGDLGSVFSDGASFAVRLRYRMRYERGLGLSFEGDRFSAKALHTYQPDSAFADRLSVTLSEFELYQLFGTRTPTVKMISLGIGLAQQRVQLSTGETLLSGDFSGDGLSLSAGLGVEKFFYRSWAFDLSARYHAMFINQQVGHNVQIALGIIGYAGY
jgi:opacity protein-like surface antigen